MVSPAEKINEELINLNPVLYELLSELGRKMYYPKGILSQSAEASQSASLANATIGMATENGEPMFLKSIYKNIDKLTPNEVFPYAAPTGKFEVRKYWKSKILIDNPELNAEEITLPIVTNALTNGLSLMGEMFVNPGDTIILPSMYWGNYNLVFNTKFGADIKKYELFNEHGNFNLDSFNTTVDNVQSEKLIFIFNFPNNPTGYTPFESEVKQITNKLQELAQRGKKILCLVDDAYYGLFYEDVYKQSLFTAITNLQSKNILAVKIDGVTKEYFTWGFRIGFLTFGINTVHGGSILEEKLKGLIRASISSASMPSQSILENAFMEENSIEEEIKEKFNILKERYNIVKQVAYDEKYSSLWEPYPFNSGYFMAIKLFDTNAEKLRKVLLEKYKIGVISLSQDSIRIAFSCLEKEQIVTVFDLIARAISDVKHVEV